MMKKSDYRKGIYVDVDSFLLAFFKDERIRLIFTILWHTYRKRVLGKGIKRNGTPVSKCISTGRELVCVGFWSFLGMSKVERGFVFSYWSM